LTAQHDFSCFTIRLNVTFNIMQRNDIWPVKVHASNISGYCCRS